MWIRAEISSLKASPPQAGGRGAALCVHTLSQAAQVRFSPKVSLLVLKPNKTKSKERIQALTNTNFPQVREAGLKVVSRSLENYFLNICDVVAYKGLLQFDIGLS